MKIPLFLSLASFRNSCLSLVVVALASAGRPDPSGADDVVVLATPVAEGVVRAAVAPFERRTGLRVAVARIARTGAGEAAVAESVERARADVWWSPEVALTLRLKERGALLKPDPMPAGADLLPKEMRDADGFWFGFAARARIIMVNTALVPEAERPKSMWDLLDARWKGRLALARPSSGTALFHLAALEEALGGAETRRFLDGLARNGCRVVGSDAQLAELVGSGAVAAGMTDTSDCHLVRREGRPVDAIHPDQGGIGTLVIPNTIACVKAGGNPAGGRKLLEHLLSAEAEAILAAHERGHIPLGRGVSHPPEVRVPGEFQAMAVDLAKAAARAESAARTFAGIWPKPGPAAVTAGPAPRTVADFDAMEPGKPPAGFTLAQTGPGSPAAWEVREDPDAASGGKVLVQTDANDGGGRFPICVLDGVVARDVSVFTRFKAATGDADRAAGLVVRYLDADNYYCVRANSLEDNVRLYRMVDGRRIQFAGVNRVLTMEGQWHALRLDVAGAHFRVWMNGVLLFEADDATFPDAGRTGLWTKGDSITAFDDFTTGPPAGRSATDFEDRKAGETPSGWEAVSTGSAAPSSWIVQDAAGAPCGPKVATADGGEGGRRGGSALLPAGAGTRDATVSARFKVAVEGEGMHLAGLVARWRDPANHYWLRINPSECNLRLYRVADGKRHLVGERHHLSHSEHEWHAATLSVHGNRLTVSIDGERLIEAVDDAPPGAGRAGIWGVPGGGTLYDAVSVETF